ncbi:hypothetical protein [Lolliginicoccus suaedae]|uniref:hypothetical protein n=1 Tax=Lolliginicoccus suaedae TaxID=2605429 RepID=UPI0011ECD6DE|nr:hypothetical protein [Lolliginicoccus suaedae]
MKDPEIPGQEASFPDKAGRALARLAYLFILLSVVALALTLYAAGTGSSGPAWIAGASCVALVAAAAVAWLWQARRKRRTHLETKDRQLSTEGKGPLDI